MEGKMLDFLLFQILWRVGFEWHAIITHPSLTMSTHFFISVPWYLTILLV